MILGVIYCKDSLTDSNIGMLNGRPLITYTLEAASRCTIFDDLIVTTDSKDIADVAMHYGAKVPFLLADGFRANAISDWPIYLNVVEKYEKQFGTEVNYVVIINTTTPLVNTADIEGALKMALLYPETEVVVTGYRTDKNPYFNMVEVNKKGYAEIIRKESEPIVRLEDAPHVFILAGTAIVIKKSALYNYAYWSQAVCRVYEVPRTSALDIKDASDYELVKLQLNRQHYI